MRTSIFVLKKCSTLMLPPALFSEFYGYWTLKCLLLKLVYPVRSNCSLGELTGLISRLYNGYIEIYK